MATTDKEALRRGLTPKAVLRALTPEALRAVPAGMLVDDMLSIVRFPFRVGRESRGRVVDGTFIRTERPKRDNSEPNNDLYLADPGPGLFVSREHFAIERSGTGYVLIDRGSAGGTSAGGNRVGGRDAGGSAPLKDGDVISVGAENTPYRYAFITLE
jgi:pSer/pThr/pTyr-binding forkhead associated (FHA) protein